MLPPVCQPYVLLVVTLPDVSIGGGSSSYQFWKGQHWLPSDVTSRRPRESYVWWAGEGAGLGGVTCRVRSNASWVMVTWRSPPPQGQTDISFHKLRWRAVNISHTPHTWFLKYFPSYFNLLKLCTFYWKYGSVAVQFSLYFYGSHGHNNCISTRKPNKLDGDVSQASGRSSILFVGLLVANGIKWGKMFFQGFFAFYNLDCA